VTILLVVTVLFALSAMVHLPDRVDDALRGSQHLDEILTLVVLLTAGIAVFAVRRWRQGLREHELRRETEARFRAVVEESPAVSYTWSTAERRATYVSPQIVHLLGYSIQEWTGPELWIDALHPEDRDRVLEASFLADRTGRPFIQEYRVSTRDGRILWLHDESNYVAFDQDGRPTLAQGVMYDVTARKEAEARWQEAEAKFRTIVEHVPAVAYVWDSSVAPGAAPASYISPQIERLLGYTADEWRRDPDAWARALHPDDRDLVVRAWEEAVAEGKAFAAEYRLRRKDGAWVWLSDEANPVGPGPAGRPMYQGVMFDVTARKEAEVRLQERETRSRTLLENLPVVAYMSQETGDGTTVDRWVSPGIEALTGSTVEEWLAVEEPWLQVIHPDDRARVTAAWTEHVESEGGRFTIEYRIERRDGTIVWIRDESVLMPGTNTSYLEGVFIDITALRQAEMAASEAEERFRTLVEHIPVVTYASTVNAEGEDVFIYVAPGITGLLGYTPQECVNDPGAWARMIHPGDRARVLQHSREADEIGGPFEIEYRIIARDGREVWVHDSAVVLHRTDSGAIVWQGIIQDVTGRRATDQRMREAEERYRTLIEQLPAITFIEEAETGAPVYVSPQIEWMYGYTPQEWAADPLMWERCLHPGDRDWVVAESEREDGDSWSVDYRTITRDGRVLWVHNESVLIRDEDGQSAYWQGVVFDITARKEAEERLREAEERYRLLVEQLPVAVYTDAVDDLSTALYISPQYEHLTGYSPQQRLADPGLWMRMLHPDDRDRVLAESERTNQTGEPFDIEYRITGALGDIVWLHDHAIMVVGPDGGRVWQGVLTDVTERKLAQDALSRRDRILQATGFAAERFLQADSWEEALEPVLARLGDAGDATRAYVYANDPSTDAVPTTVSLVCGWSTPGWPTPVDDQQSRSFPWEEGGFGRWAETLRAGRVIQGPLEEFPEPERLVLDRPGRPVRSLLVVPIFVRNGWWGYIGFDHARDARIWHEAEIEALTVTANTLGAAIARAMAQRELAETQRRYQTLVEQIPAMTYVERANEGGALYYSPQTLEVLGFGPQEWGEYEHWVNALHPEDRDRVIAEDRRTNETGEPYRMEYRLIAKGGRIVWVRDQAVLVRDDDGSPVYWQGVRFDITAEKEAEEQLRSAEERYRGIVEHVPAAIYLDRTGASMETVYISPQIESITGITPEQWVSDPQVWVKAMDPEDRDAIVAQYTAAANEGRPWSAEYRMRTPDGRTIWVHDETTFLHDDQGRAVYLQGVLFDVTERKLAEQALRESEQREREAAERLRAVDEMKNTFLAAVSHELRSPLTSILGLSLTLERAPDIEERDREDLLQRLASNARKLDRLLKDLLDIDRLNRGIVEPQYRVTDVGALARRTVESLDALTGRDVITQTDAIVLSVDPPKLERIIENLLVNAVRHTTPDRHIWLRVRPHESGVLIVVEDDGPGVPPEIRGSIFEPFHQGPTASAHSPGTGIGLSLVARFAELHGGRAWVDEREGGGASFRVYIPGMKHDAGFALAPEPLPRAAKAN